MDKNSKFILTLLLPFTCATAANAQSASYYNKNVAKMENRVQQQKPEFRIVKSVEQFPDRINATEKLHIVTKPNYVTVSLHDRDTGRPLEACTTPCTLHREPGVGYGLNFYKMWYWPQKINLARGQFGDIEPIHMNMGMNFYEVQKKRKKCLSDFRKSEKIDGDATPCYRVPPTMPRRAKRSGHCIMTYDIDENGRTNNIVHKSCTDEIFAKPSKNSIAWWRFNPKVERGVAVPQYGAENKISFRLKDKDGNIVPED